METELFIDTMKKNSSITKKQNIQKSKWESVGAPGHLNKVDTLLAPSSYPILER